MIDNQNCRVVLKNLPYFSSEQIGSFPQSHLHEIPIMPLRRRVVEQPLLQQAQGHLRLRRRRTPPLLAAENCVVVDLLGIRRVEAEESGADGSLARAGAQSVVEGAAVGGNRHLR